MYENTECFLQYVQFSEFGLLIWTLLQPEQQVVPRAVCTWYEVSDKLLDIKKIIEQICLIQ